MTLRVIGAGYGRTGTASLKTALEKLGFGPCHHMSEVLPSPERIDRWRRIGEGEPLWDQAFEGYNSTVDWPSCTHWRALMNYYPDAKIILSLRDAGKWFESVNTTILEKRVCEALKTTPMGPMMQANVWGLFDGRMQDREYMMAAFERHCAEVIGSVPKERLLVFEPKQGWAPLCEFLGVDVPSEPFPHLNTQEEITQIMRQLADDILGGAQTARRDFADEMYEGKARKQ